MRLKDRFRSNGAKSTPVLLLTLSLSAPLLLADLALAETERKQEEEKKEMVVAFLID